MLLERGYRLLRTSPLSAASNAVTPSAPTAPGAPTALVASAANQQATVRWTAPNDGGRTITRYTVTPYLNGVAQATRLLSGWGLKFFDYDNDGHLDLFLANGHPDDMIGEYSQMVKYKEPLLVFHNNGMKLENVSASAGPVSSRFTSSARASSRCP